MNNTGTAFKVTSNPEAFVKEWRSKNPKLKAVSVEIQFEQPAAKITIASNSMPIIIND